MKKANEFYPFYARSLRWERERRKQTGGFAEFPLHLFVSSIKSCSPLKNENIQKRIAWCIQESADSFLPLLLGGWSYPDPTEGHWIGQADLCWSGLVADWRWRWSAGVIWEILRHTCVYFRWQYFVRLTWWLRWSSFLKTSSALTTYFELICRSPLFKGICFYKLLSFTNLPIFSIVRADLVSRISSSCRQYVLWSKMSFMSLDNVNVTEESFGRSEIQLDWYNFSCCLSFLFLAGLQLLLIFGPVGWMIWLLFGASMEFLQSSEGSTSNTEDEEDETVDKKVNNYYQIL